MVIAVAYALAVVGTGYATLRALGLAKGPLGLGLAPAVGLAALTVLTTWTFSLGLPPIVGGLALAAFGVAGLALAARQWRPALEVALSTRASRLTFGLLGASVVIPAVVLGVGLAGVSVPLSPHDGAFHVELVEQLRRSGRLEIWYPTGLHATWAALLQWFPGVDTAEGVFQASVGVSLLAPLAAFGLASAVWGRPLAAAAGAVLVALAFQYPYHVHLWGGWPLAAAILLTLGLWTIGIEHLRRPTWRWAALGGLLAAAIVLMHGTESISTAIGLVLLVLGAWRRASWRRMPIDVGLALVVALVLAAPYLPNLLGWLRGGGSVETGTLEAAAGAANVSGRDLNGDFFTFLLDGVGAGPLVDLPARIVFLAVGVGWALRWRSGRVVAAIGATFLALALTFTYFQVPVVQRLYALTFPWGLNYRLLMAVAVTFSLVEGLGLWATGRWLAQLPARWPGAFGPAHPVAWRRLKRLGVVGGLTALVVLTVGLAVLLANASEHFRVYTPDDAAAMAWMREHVRPGEVVANDAYADAGIWAPFKAGVAILEPRITRVPADTTRLILANVGQLESAPEARAAACGLGVRYVYSGATDGRWEKRHFPPLAELRASSALEEVFASGQAAVFRVRCGS